MWGSHVIVVVLFSVSAIRFTAAIVSKSKVKLESNRYTGLVIAINPNVTEDPKLIDAIQVAWTGASPALFGATRNRAYFGDITILVPTTWTSYASHTQASDETYDKADVLIADPNPAYGDAPYTLQYGGCGSQGSYIHFTPKYFTDDSIAVNFGTREKVIVHEWAHYRWGVFDETSASEPFYEDPTGNTLYDANTGEKSLSYTQCGKNIEVCCVDQVWQECDPTLWIDNPGQAHCAINSQTGLYSDGCICYMKQSTDVYDASLMSYQHVDSIFTFCEDTTNSSSRVKHNKYAPNDQNRLCNLRSTWSVILESVDFTNSNPPVSMTSGFSPSFNIKTVSKNQRFVLVIDVSGSMDTRGADGETRLDRAIKAARHFIVNSSPTGSYVGIVQFSTGARVISYLTKLDDEEARNSLAEKLPKSAGGSTCIGCGINSGIEVLEHAAAAADGGYLLVLTDGQENQSPTIQDVYDTVINKAVIVQTIMVFTDANDILSRLSIESGGGWFFAGSDDLLALIGAYNKIGTVETGDETQKKFEIMTETVKMDNMAIFHESLVNIDSTIGNQTVFTYTWSQGSQPPNVAITPPNGSCVISNYQANTCSSQISVDYNYKTMTAVIPGTAEVGVWKSNVQISTSASQTIVIVVTSTAADAKTPPIKVESAVEMRNGIPVVYAKVTQGFNPVLGAKVTATLSREGHSDHEIQLYDAGAEPDIRRNDGIYSRFAAAIAQGRYSVKIHVGSNFDGSGGNTANYMASAATYNPGYVTSNGTVVANPNGPRFVPKNTTIGVTSDQLGNFSRQSSAGAFEYTPPTPPRGEEDTHSSDGVLDFLPPSKVIDLKVAQNDFDNFTNGIVLTFTAPGDDLDTGKAAEYEIRLTTGNMETLLDDFTSNDQVNIEDVIEGNISNPQEAGSIERIVVSTPNIALGNATSISIGFALRAVDKANNVAQVSNVASLRYYIEPPAFAAPQTTQPPTTQPPTTQPATTEQETVVGGFSYGRKCQTSLRFDTKTPSKYDYYGYGYYGYYGYGYYGAYRRCPSTWCQYCIQTVYVYTLGNMRLTRPLCVRGTECRSRYCYGNCQCSTRLCSCYRNAHYYYHGRIYVTQVQLSYPCGAYSSCRRG